MANDVGTICERLRKLLAHAEIAEAMGSTAEAAAFAGKASALLLAHKLTTSDLNLGEVDADPIDADFLDVEAAGVGGHRKRVMWLEKLAGTLATHHFCEVLVYPNSARLRLVGRRSDREVVEYLFETLTRTLRAQAAVYVAERRGMGVRSDVLWRAFALGFVSAIRKRLDEQRKESEAAGGSFAVARFRGADAATERWLRQNIGRVREARGGAPAGNRHAYGAGVEAGHAAHLGANGIGQGSAPTGTLARGTALLGAGGGR